MINPVMRSRIFNFLFIASVSIFLLSCVKPVKFAGTSMLPAIKDGDRLLMNTTVGNLDRGDIVDFLYPKDKTQHYVKRIVGLPGETFEIREGKILINNSELKESYVHGPYNTVKTSRPPVVIGKDHYFVLGDNRDNSSDSRYWGTVSRDLITGKYLMTYA